MDRKEEKKLEEFIDSSSSTHTDWKYIEEILESLQDFECLNKKGIEFRDYIWEEYVKEREKK